MKFLYIDKANSIEDIRIAERTIWGDEMLALGHTVNFLLVSAKKQKKTVSNGDSNNIHYPNSLLISLFLFAIRLPILIRKIKPDYLVVRNVLDLGLISHIYAWIFEIKIIYIKAFPYLEVKSINKKSLVKFGLNCMLKTEIWLMNSVDFLLIRTQEFKQQLRVKYNIKRESLIVPMGVDASSLNEITEVEKEEIKLKFSLNSEYIGIYFGAIDKMRRIDFLLEILEDVSSNRKNLDFMIVGGNEDQTKHLRKECAERNLNIRVISALNREDLFKIIQLCDFSVSPIPPIAEYILSSPTKVIESLGLGCPVIVNKEILDQNEIIENSKGGISTNYDIKDFSKEIVNILDGQRNLNKMGREGKEFVLSQRSYKEMTNKIEQYLKLDRTSN